MKRYVCIAAGIVSGLMAVLLAAIELESAQNAGDAGVGVFINAISYPFIGFFLGFGLAALLLFTRAERRRYLSEISVGWRGVGALTALVLFGGHVAELVRDLSSVKGWLFSMAFAAVCFVSARSYFHHSTR